MKTLIVGFDSDITDLNAKFSSFTDSSPYGYDTIVVNSAAFDQMIGHSPTVSKNVTWLRWYEDLKRWLRGNHRIIVTLNPVVYSNDQSNYNWLPLEGFKENSLIPCGANDFVGSIISKDSYVKSHLNSINKGTVTVHYRYKDPVEHLFINSKIDDDLLTSFTWKLDDAEVIFVPQTSLSALSPLINSFESASNRWKVPKLEEIENKIIEINSSIESLEAQRSDLVAEVSKLNREIADLVTRDVYLAKAIRSFELTQSTSDPEPENFYEVIESIENSFKSERDMRETLGFSKAFIGKVQRRTNEFRHVAKDGKEPESLTPNEITEFTHKTEEIISKYIQYLHDNS